MEKINQITLCFKKIQMLRKMNLKLENSSGLESSKNVSRRYMQENILAISLFQVIINQILKGRPDCLVEIHGRLVINLGYMSNKKEKKDNFTHS